MARPVVDQARLEYQDRINFVLWDYDRDDEYALARGLGVAQHPAFAVVAPDSDEVVERLFGPLSEQRLRAVIEDAIARFEG